MTWQRILVLRSINDDLVEDWLQHIRNRPGLSSCDIECCYAVEPTEEQKSGSSGETIEEMVDKALDEGDLVRRIDTKIQDFQPDAFVVHTGIVLMKDPELFLRVCSALKEKHPGVAFGLESTECFDSGKDLREMFDQSSEMAELVSKLLGLESWR